MLIARIRKALVAAVAAGAAAYAQALPDGVTTAEWEIVAGTVVVTAILTWLVPNKPAPQPPAGVTGRYVPPAQ